MDRFIKDMESVMRRPVHEDDTADVDSEEGSSSDMDFGTFGSGFIMSYFIYCISPFLLEYMDLNIFF